jgi:hypothetical protein
MPIGGLRPVPVDIAEHEGFIEGPGVPAIARLLAACLAQSDGSA